MAAAPPTSDIVISRMDLIYHYPHVVRNVATGADVDGIIDNDTELLASVLKAYLTRPSGSSSCSPYTLLKASTETDSASLARSVFLLRELTSDMDSSYAADFYPDTKPALKQEIELVPPIEVVANHPNYQLASRHAALLDNFGVGMQLILDVPVVGRVRLTVDTIQGASTTLILSSNASPMADMTSAQAYITAVQVPDAARVNSIARFCAFRDAVGTQDVADATSFNEQLYRLLYVPVNPDLQFMPVQELMDDYTDNPERIACVADLSFATAEALRDTVRIHERLSLAEGATLSFSEPWSGNVTGLVTGPQSHFSDVATSDGLILTAHAASNMIDSAVQLEREQTRVAALSGDPYANAAGDASAVVPGVLHASRAIGGVHCSLALGVGGQIDCQRLATRSDVTAPGLIMGRTVDARDVVTAPKVVADEQLRVGGDALVVQGSEVHAGAPETTMQNLFANNIRASGDVTTLRRVQASTIGAHSIDCHSDMSCLQMHCVDSHVSGVLNVKAGIQASSICVSGFDLVNEVRQLRADQDSLASQIRTLSARIDELS